MHYLYVATVFAGALVCLLAALLLLARRKAGERSRVILAIMVSFSVYNYITRFIALCNGKEPEFVLSGRLLLTANFMVVCYIVYLIEVIFPGWLNIVRTLKVYSFLFLLVFVYLVSLWFGVEYPPYSSLIEMGMHDGGFDSWFRLLLSLLIFSPFLFFFFIRRTRRYRNSDTLWIKKYMIVKFINTFAYGLVLIVNHMLIHTLYYYVSVGCSLYIVYMELFDRLICEPIANTEMNEEQSFSSYEKYSFDQKNKALVERLDTYMKTNKAWRNPDLSLNSLASELCTNRTTLAQAMRENGYDNYTNYINKLRIDDFLLQIESKHLDNFQDAFFFAGFRSRGTALRNFKLFTGTTPSEYFQKNTPPTIEKKMPMGK